MPHRVAINPRDGEITFGSHVLPLDVRLDQLPASFVSQPDTSTSLEMEAPIKIKTACLDDGDTHYELDLRFEHQELVSVFLTIQPKRFQDLGEDAFYESAEERSSFHVQWLKKSGLSTDNLKTSWGAVGVARDRSKNVWIYVHTKNNKWAFGESVVSPSRMGPSKS